MSTPGSTTTRRRLGAAGLPTTMAGVAAVTSSARGDDPRFRSMIMSRPVPIGGGFLKIFSRVSTRKPSIGSNPTEENVEFSFTKKTDFLDQPVTKRLSPITSTAHASALNNPNRQITEELSYGEKLYKMVEEGDRRSRGNEPGKQKKTACWWADDGKSFKFVENADFKEMLKDFKVCQAEDASSVGITSVRRNMNAYGFGIREDGKLKGEKVFRVTHSSFIRGVDEEQLKAIRRERKKKKENNGLGNAKKQKLSEAEAGANLAEMNGKLVLLKTQVDNLKGQIAAATKNANMRGGTADDSAQSKTVDRPQCGDDPIGTIHYEFIDVTPISVIHLRLLPSSSPTPVIVADNPHWADEQMVSRFYEHLPGLTKYRLKKECAMLQFQDVESAIEIYKVYNGTTFGSTVLNLKYAVQGDQQTHCMHPQGDTNKEAGKAHSSAPSSPPQLVAQTIPPASPACTAATNPSPSPNSPAPDLQTDVFSNDGSLHLDTEIYDCIDRLLENISASDPQTNLFSDEGSLNFDTNLEFDPVILFGNSSASEPQTNDGSLNAFLHDFEL